LSSVTSTSITCIRDSYLSMAIRHSTILVHQRPSKDCNDSP
jgi:hypothetical protein